MVISTQGTWCLRHNLSTSASSIHAIEIDTPNVTIDCNGYKIGNGPAGTDISSIGIFADGIANITVRHCTILGFQTGISIDAGTPNDGHLIEDNVLSQNRINGMIVMGNSVILQHNRVVDTGGNSSSITGFGIQTSGDVIDNVVDGIVAASGVSIFEPFGIQIASGNGLLVQGNRVRNIGQKGALGATGISVAGGTGTEVRDNYVVQGSSTSGTGIACASGTRARDNVVRNWTGGISGCSDDGGNVNF